MLIHATSYSLLPLLACRVFSMFTFFGLLKILFRLRLEDWDGLARFITFWMIQNTRTTRQRIRWWSDTERLDCAQSPFQLLRHTKSVCLKCWISIFFPGLLALLSRAQKLFIDLKVLYLEEFMFSCAEGYNMSMNSWEIKVVFPFQFNRVSFGCSAVLKAFIRNGSFKYNWQWLKAHSKEKQRI